MSDDSTFAPVDTALGAAVGSVDERVLNERRRHGDAPFDVAPVRGATLADIDLPRFQYLYLPQAFAAEVLARNDRTVEERLAATKMIVHPDDPTPTVLGMLALCPKPTRFLPGAYVQFVRFDGEERADPIVDNERIDSPLADAMAELDRVLRANVRESVQLGRTEVRRATYAVSALRELVRNAVMHRSYEGTSSPIALHWFAEHIEITSPGGPYGHVTADNFGQPGLVDYRNPNLADAMRVAGLVQRFGVGLPEARAALSANAQEEPRFMVGRAVGAVSCSGAAGLARQLAAESPATAWNMTNAQASRGWRRPRVSACASSSA